MSHFAVLVIDQDGADLDAIMQPYHEFECTGINDEYVKDVDQTAEKRQEYEDDTVLFLRHADTLEPYYIGGAYNPRFVSVMTVDQLVALHAQHSHPASSQAFMFEGRELHAFSRDPRRMVFDPAGWEEVRQPAKDALTFAQWLVDDGIKGVPFGETPDYGDPVEGKGPHRYGYFTVDAAGEVARVIDRTNPNKKWDWWSVGGRYAGRLDPKLAQATGVVQPPDFSNWTWRDVPVADRPTGVDSLLKSDLDIDGSRQRAATEAAELWDKVHAAAQDLWLSWAACKEKHTVDGETDHDAARVFYHAQPAITRIEEAKLLGFLSDKDQFLTDRTAYVKQAWQTGVSAFAILKDGQWYERGTMGWWGIVSDESPAETWADIVQRLVDEAPDTARFTVVDCHI